MNNVRTGIGISNLNACAGIARSSRGLLGPNKVCKFIVSEDHSALEGDSFKILNEIVIKHPVGAIVREICHGQKKIFGTVRFLSF